MGSAVTRRTATRRWLKGSRKPHELARGARASLGQQSEQHVRRKDRRTELPGSLTLRLHGLNIGGMIIMAGGTGSGGIDRMSFSALFDIRSSRGWLQLEQAYHLSGRAGRHGNVDDHACVSGVRRFSV